MVENAPLTWFEWCGLKYFKYSKILTNKMAKSPKFKTFAQYFGQEPGPLALGVAEGYLLYKVTYPIHVGLQLYGLVKYTQVYSYTASTICVRLSIIIGKMCVSFKTS